MGSQQEDSAVSEAKRLIDAGRCQEAIDLLEPVVAEQGDDPAAWSTLAAAYFGLEAWPQARVAAEKAIQFNPDSAREWCNLGTVLRKSGLYADAEEAQQRALQLDPGHKRALAELQKARRAQAEERAGTEESPAPTAPRPLLKIALVSALAVAAVMAVVIAGITIHLRGRVPASDDVVASVDLPDDARSPANAIAVSPQAPAAQTGPRAGSPSPSSAPVTGAPASQPQGCSAEERPLTRRQLVAEGRRLYEERRYKQALALFRQAADQGSTDAIRWCEACVRRMEDQRAGLIAAAGAAEAEAEAEKLANLPRLNPPAAVRSRAIELAKNAVRSQIVVSLESGSRGERFLRTDVRVLSAQQVQYEDVVPVWTGELAVSGIVQIPNPLGGGKVWRDYDFTVIVVKPPGQGAQGEGMYAMPALVSMR